MKREISLEEKRQEFENNKCIYESKKLVFKGVDGHTVYNPSIPFEWNGKKYIYGRVERFDEWARSWVKLFENTEDDVWRLVPNSMFYQLEDPCISVIGDTFVLGGTHVRMKSGNYDNYFGYFYKGTELEDLCYFTTGPDLMKDIRLVGMKNNCIGVFSRPRNEEIEKKYGSRSVIGFTVINSLDELTAEVIENAPIIPGLIGNNEWGGCNQCYYLDSGLIGVIAHMGYEKNGIFVYVNVSFVFDPIVHIAKGIKIIGTRPCYPDGPFKRSNLNDCVFSSGIVMREDGKVDLYSGIGDCEVGRIVIDYPFEGYGEIV